MDDFDGSIEQRDRQIKSLRAENEKLKKLLNKDRLFKFIFGHPDNRQWTLELYNAVNGTDYKDADELQFNTIGEALYLRMKNDISFIIYFEMNLWEHQSTFNPNMPMRFLRYAASLYEKFIATTDYYEYSSTLQKIPTPKCVCFYNGTQDQPEKQVLSLSDAYEGKGDIEVNVTMLNINYGKNRKLMEACAPLKEYAWLVDAVRRHQGERMDLDAAVDASVDEMPGDFVIHEFIIANRAEVKSMLLTEYNEEKIMEKERQEGEKRGEKRGQKEVASLMSFLASNGRSDDIVRAGQDENFLNKLLSDFRSGMMAAE